MVKVGLPSGYEFEVDVSKPKLQQKLKELQGSDYEKLGLSRGILATASGDDEKMAKSLVEDGKKQKRNIVYYMNGRGEVVVTEDGKDLGLINKSGASKQDLWNLVRDPTNILLAVPGVGEVLKGASLASKALKAAKLAGATSAIDLATTTAADISNKEGLKNTESNIKRAVLTGALAPVNEVVFSKLATGVANKVLPKKAGIKQGEVPLTKGQATGNKADLGYETDVEKGVYGARAQEIFDEYKNKQIRSFEGSLKKDLKDITFGDNSRNLDLGDEIQYSLRAKKDASNRYVEGLYKRINKDGVAVDVYNAKSLVDSLENALEPGARRNVEKHGVEAPEYKSIKFIDTLREDLNKTNKPMSLREIESSRRTLNSNIEQAVAKQNNEAVKDLMSIKNAYDEGIASLAAENRLLGDKREVLKLLQARAAEAEHAKKFENTKISLDNKVKDQVTSFGAKDVIDFINNPSKAGDDLATIFNGNNEAKKIEVVNKIKEIAGKEHDKELRELYLNSLFSDVGRVGREANINPNEAIKKVTERLEKSDKVAKKLFSPDEIQQIKRNKELLKKINTRYDVNPSGTASKDIKKGVLNFVVNKIPIPVAGDAARGIQNNIINPFYLKRYLAAKSVKTNRFNDNSLVAKLGRVFGVSISNEKNK